MRAPGLKQLYMHFAYPGYSRSFEKIPLDKQKKRAFLEAKGGGKHKATSNLSGHLSPGKSFRNQIAVIIKDDCSIALIRNDAYNTGGIEGHSVVKSIVRRNKEIMP